MDQAAGTTETNRTNMETGSQDFLTHLEQQASQGPLIINSVKLSVAPGQTTAPDKPITIAGSASSSVGTPIEAIVIDARALPAGTVLELKNVEFAVIIGDNVTVRGGDGSNIVFAGSGSQNIVLGPEDDELHGGSGDDFVGSEGGNDRLFGDAGNDTLRGGADNDYLDGGTGTDTALYAGKLADYQISQLADGRWRVADQRTGSGNEGVDILKDMELVKFADQTISIGANYDLDHDAIPDFLETASGTSSNAKDKRCLRQQQTVRPPALSRHPVPRSRRRGPEVLAKPDRQRNGQQGTDHPRSSSNPPSSRQVPPASPASTWAP